MASSAPAAAGRRFMFGALAALPMLPELLAATAAQAQTAPLASWNDGRPDFNGLPLRWKV
jgi:hypothetical protein